jgi:hypothetical protein
MALNSFPTVQPILFLVVAVAAVGLGKQPNGIAGWVFSFSRSNTRASSLLRGYLGAPTLARSVASRAVEEEAGA